MIPKQKRNYFRSESTICRVRFKGQSGRGAIYGNEFPEKTWRTLFISSYQVLSISDISEITELRLVFKDQHLGNLDLTPDWVKWLWTSPRDKLNTTIIEFSPTAIKILSREQYTLLLSETPQLNSKVIIHDYNSGISHGSILNIIGDTIEVKAEIDSCPLAGVPLLNENHNVIGIHDSLIEKKDQSSNVTLKAINIVSIFSAYSDYIKSFLNGKTEDEIWLEKIHMIPKKDFELIGRGGFGTVFKIKIDTELALKIVGGFGNLSYYQSQVRALKNRIRNRF